MKTTPDRLADDFLERLSTQRRTSPKNVCKDLRALAAVNVNAALAVALQLGLRAAGTDYSAPLVHSVSNDVDPFDCP